MRAVRNVPNPISKWQEMIEVEGITLYDIHREKRKQLEEDCDRNLPQSVITSELTCPICLAIMTHTHIVMECLHRFCGSCIEKCLRVGRHECPSCRQRVPSRRSLRPDPNFDCLIAKLYSQEQQLAPDTIDAEALMEHKRKYQEHVQKIRQDARQRQKQRRVTTTRERSQNQSASAAVCTTAIDRTITQEARRQRPHILDTARGAPTAAPSAPKVRITLVPFADSTHPGWSALNTLTRPHIRAPNATTISVLKKYIMKMLPEAPSVDTLELLALYNERYVILDDLLDLRAIVFNFWERKGQLLIFYRAVQTFTHNIADWDDTHTSNASRNSNSTAPTTTGVAGVPLTVG